MFAYNQLLLLFSQYLVSCPDKAKILGINKHVCALLCIRALTSVQLMRLGVRRKRLRDTSRIFAFSFPSYLEPEGADTD